MPRKPTKQQLLAEAIREASCGCDGRPVRVVEDGLSLIRCTRCGRISAQDPATYTPPRLKGV